MTNLVEANNFRTSDDLTDVFGIKGFGGQGVSKFSGAIQAGRLGYRTAKWAYGRYFRASIRNPSRAAGTGTGTGIGIGSTINFANKATQRRTQAGYINQKYQYRSKYSGRKHHRGVRNCQCC